ncbi:Tab2 family RNA-binding protein [Trichothermofontia sp.]
MSDSSATPAADRMPPQPLPADLWGEQWRFASLPAGELMAAFRDRPMPVLDLPEARSPLSLGLAAPLPIPGVIITGGRRSLSLALWLQAAQPVALKFIPGPLNGLILEAGERVCVASSHDEKGEVSPAKDRWVLATFDDAEVTQSAQLFVERKYRSRGLHFLLVQPDDSGMTYSGFWLLQDPALGE